MKASTHALSFDGGFLQRGFWLYVWEITVPDGRALYYVGRTGDSSSNNAQSPYNRMGQHLGLTNKASNMLRQNLQRKGIAAEQCHFKFISYGPIMEEAATSTEHRRLRDLTAALEKALAVSLAESGYEVLNTVKCRKKLDQNLWKPVCEAFISHFPRISQPSHTRTQRKR